MRRFRSVRTGVLLFCFCASVAAVFLLWAHVRRNDSIQDRQRRLFTAVVMLHNYCDTYEKMPPLVEYDDSGDVLGSWRFLCLPFLPSPPAVELDKPWKDPANSDIATSAIYPFCFHGDDSVLLTTNIVAVGGEGTAWDVKSQFVLGEFPDDLIVLIETADSRAHWMAATDLNVNHLDPVLKLGFDGHGVNVGFCDHTVWYLDKSVPLSLLRTFCTVDGAQRLDRESDLAPFVIVRNDGR